jgi:hypothetical protein
MSTKAENLSAPLFLKEGVLAKIFFFAICPICASFIHSFL